MLFFKKDLKKEKYFILDKESHDNSKYYIIPEEYWNMIDYHQTVICLEELKNKDDKKCFYCISFPVLTNPDKFQKCAIIEIDKTDKKNFLKMFKKGKKSEIDDIKRTLFFKNQKRIEEQEKRYKKRMQILN